MSGMHMWCLTFAVLAAVSVENSAGRRFKFKLGMMYAGMSSDWKEGISNLYAAQLAARDITATQNVDVTISPFNGNCSSYLTPDRFSEFGDLLQTADVKGIIGPECSHHSNGVVSFFAHPFFKNTPYQKPFLTPSATSRDPFYLGPGETQLFASLVADVHQMQELSVKIAHKFNWKRFGIVHSMRHLPWVKTLEEAMQGGLQATMIQQEGLSVQDMRRQLQVFVDHDIKIFFVLISTGWNLLCVAADMNLMGSSNVWFVDAWLWEFAKNEMRKNCTAQQLELVLNSNPLLDVQEWSRSEKGADETISGYNSSEVLARVEDNLKKDNILLIKERNLSWDLLAYDCVWLMSLAVKTAMEKCSIQSDVSYCEENWADLVMHEMHSIEFEGASGRVGLKDYATKYPAVRAFYFKEWNTAVELLTANSEEIKFLAPFDWRDWKNTSIILDHTVRLEVVKQNRTEKIGFGPAVTGISVCGIMTLFCTLLLIFNFYYRHQKLIKMTSPTINNLILLGSMLIYLSTMLSSAKAFSTNPTVLTYCCRVELCLMSLGFTIGYGSLFSKTWRIYKIFTDRGAKASTNVRVKDQQLLMFILVVTIFDILLLGIWLLVSPITIVQSFGNNESIHKEDHVLEVQWIAQHCVSKMTAFPYVFIFTKGFVLLYGAFLAYETRHVHIEELNDSRNIGISIYNTIILSGFGLLASFAIKTDPTMTYLLMGSIKVFCVAITICIIFLPKVSQLRKDPEGKNLNVTRRMTLNNRTSAASNPSQKLSLKVKCESPQVRKTTTAHFEPIIESQEVAHDHLLDPFKVNRSDMAEDNASNIALNASCSATEE